MDNKTKGILDLCRISNLPTVLSNCVGSWLIAGAALGEFNLLVLVLGAALFYSGGMVMNDVFDVAFDNEFRPDRPIPSGIVSKCLAVILTLIFMVSGLTIMILGGAQLLFVLALSVVIIAYNFFHKRWSYSVYIMGACRSMLYLACASAVSVNIPHSVFAWCVCLGLYTAGITVVARGEATDREVKIYGLIFLLCPVIVPVYLGFNSLPLHLIGSVVAGSLWLSWTIYCLCIIKGSDDGRVGRAVSYLIAGMVLIDAFALSSHLGLYGLFFVPLLPLVIWFQSKVSGT